MGMTLEQYILNPMGKNNAVLNSLVRENIKKTYSAKFDNIILRENGKIEYYLYTDSKSNTYWIYMKIPSEIVPNFYYDVVFKFYTDESVESAGIDLMKYKVKFYSNDPAFVYTYAHVFAKNDLFIQELIPKMSKIAIKDRPKEKNPTEDVGYVKSLYFGYLLIKNRNLNKKIRFTSESKPLDLKVLLSSIEDADIKVAKRQEEGNKISKRKKITVDKNIVRNIKNRVGDADTSKLQVQTTKRITNIKNKVNNSKSVKTTKSSNKK